MDDLERKAASLQQEAQAALAANPNSHEAVQLRAQVAGLAQKFAAIRATHQEKASIQIKEMRSNNQLENLKPGARTRPWRSSPIPAFPDYSSPNRIQLITVAFRASADCDKSSPRAKWLKRTQDTFDFAALAALLR